ncbi:hypothetical protein pdam_00001809 [Pocillopora damicornis]|uniref:Potassium channel domain-containing protein n=1 Tax=Pocillopora damicornis TaxID=46731 RepID=A0A3M6TNG8_POCDA|nr:hypothetical protein pdam_00001809 [Pocillopora damicornis]
MLSVFIVIVCAANLQFCIASIGNSSINQNYTTRTVPPTNHRRIIVVGWIHKPPYLYAVPNTTQPSGMGEEMALRFLHSCGATFVDSHQASSEFEMINLLRKKKIDVAAPIFEPTSDRHYSEFHFIKTSDYPGTVYISIENGDVVLNAVLDAWPLVAFNLVLAAIAGIFIWALDTYWNPEEFNRPFLKGSWDGFWWSFISMTTVGYGDKVPKSVVALFGDIDGAIQALKAHEVDGIMLDRFTASFYQKQDKLKALITVKTMQFQRDSGFLVSKSRASFANCLDYVRPNIYQFGLSLANSFKLIPQKPEKTASVFDDRFTKLKHVFHISLGVLSALLLIGILWESVCYKKRQKKSKAKQDLDNLGFKEKKEIFEELEEGRRALQRAQEQLEKLHAKFQQ